MSIIESLRDCTKQLSMAMPSAHNTASTTTQRISQRHGVTWAMPSPEAASLAPANDRLGSRPLTSHSSPGMDASEISQPKSAEYRHPKPPTRLSNTTSTAATAKQDISHGRMPCVSNLRSRGSAKAIKVSGVAVKIAPTITS